jgi:hypothetical protein
MMIDALPPQNDVDVVRRAREILAARLPGGWLLQPVANETKPDRRADAVFTVTSPDGVSARLVVEAKRAVEGRDISGIVQQLAGQTSRASNDHGVLAARYLSPQVRERLIDNGVSFIDATGNIRIDVSSPGLYISDRGADGDPWRGPGRPLGTLKGAPAARVVRAIADISSEWTVRELVDAARVSTGACYRVIGFLEREGLATRVERGEVAVPRWDKVLRRWSADYSFMGNGRVTRWMAPRGLDHLLARIAETEAPDYAITGTIAAAEWAAHAPARSAMIYAADAEACAAAWDLRPADAAANVILAEPDIDVPFVRTVTNSAGLRLASPTQVVVDLMTAPGRGPQEAEELLEWMRANEQSWRAA